MNLPNYNKAARWYSTGPPTLYEGGKKKTFILGVRAWTARGGPPLASLPHSMQGQKVGYSKNSQSAQPAEAIAAPRAPQAGAGMRSSRRFQALPFLR